MPSIDFGIPSARHGDVIGRGGCVIRRIEGEFSVDVRVPRGRGTDVVTIIGDDDNIESARRALEDELKFMVREAPLWEYELAVPKDKYGALIGPRGATLRGIEEECLADVVVPSRSAPASEQVTVKGAEEACEKAKDQIEAVIGEQVEVTKRDGQGTVTVEEVPRADLGEPVSRALFFPNHEEEDGCTTIEAFLKYLNSPQESLDICIFAMTNNAIANAVLDCHARGVAVRVICDNDQAECRGSDILKLTHSGIECRMDKKPEHMHNKYCILDNKVLMNGSFNWTVQAQNANNENVMITSDEYFVHEFAAQYNKLWEELA